MNEILLLGCIVIVFATIVAVGKLFGETGLTAWIAVAMILANIIVAKQVNFFGLAATLGNVMFASTYLATDIITEVYGEQRAKTAINLGTLFAIIYIITTQVALLFIPNEFDMVNGLMRDMFAITFRTTAASLVMMYISNRIDVWLFAKIKKAMPEKLWLRNNVATIVCNCGENFLFTVFAFYGMIPTEEILSIALVTSLFEAVIGLCDTPFVYIGRKFAKKDGADKLAEKENMMSGCPMTD